MARSSHQRRPWPATAASHGETLTSEHSRAPKVADEGDIRPPGTGTSDISQKKVVPRPERLRSKTMTAAARAANLANSEKSTGPVTPEGKKKVSRNALEQGFFAQQDDNIIGMDIASRTVYDDILNGLMTMYSPINFLDEVRIRRLAALLFKRSQLLDRAEAGETTRSVLRYRRATRFAEPPTPPHELLEKDPAALQRRSDGVEYLVDVLEALIERMAEMKTEDDVVTAVQAAAARLNSARPSFHADVTGLLERSAVLAVITRHVLILKAEATRLANEERALRAAEEARRLVPRGKHYDGSRARCEKLRVRSTILSGASLRCGRRLGPKPGSTDATTRKNKTKPFWRQHRAPGGCRPCSVYGAAGPLTNEDTTAFDGIDRQCKP